MINQKSILVFGGGELQQYLVQKARKKGLFVVVVDPDENAFCKEKADAFYVVGGQDFENTLSIAKKHKISGLITASTDKPLVMMAKIAEELKLPFFSVETAFISTDKLRMKDAFIKNGIPCAKGLEIKTKQEYTGKFPIIAKPRDNSGSRGVVFCAEKDDFENLFDEVKSFTNKKTILVEEYISGKEYSIESLHYSGKHVVFQFTEKETTPFPYNVELGHCQPADLTKQQKMDISKIIKKIGVALNFQNCASHTELKINEKGIYVIETSPRLGGDFITSHLVPLSTGIDIESLLIDISTNNTVEVGELYNHASLVYFFNLKEGAINSLNISRLEYLRHHVKGIKELNFTLKEGEKVPCIKNSLNRYGYVILQAKNRKQLIIEKGKVVNLINQPVDYFV